jgi:5S rRNA maturation endonuclease (ribonuclease M5)
MDDGRDTIDQIKDAIHIDDVIREDEPLQDPGRRYLHGIRHDSLVVDTGKQIYVWNSRGESGDVITWLEKHRGMDFKVAVEHLAAKAHLQAPAWGSQSAEARIAARVRADALDVAVSWMHHRLLETPAARSYCEHRGWTAETIETMQLGYWNGDRSAMQAELRLRGVDMNLPIVRSLLQLPSGAGHGYLIYPHLEWGHPSYISMRLAYTGDKKALPAGTLAHYNLPVDLAGERKPYWNAIAIPGVGTIVVVEGQADAVTLEQLAIPAVALAGVKIGDTDEGRRLLLLLQKHTGVYVGLDCDDAGAAGARALAEILGPEIHIVHWEDHDVNDWLRSSPLTCTTRKIEALLKSAPMYVEELAKSVITTENSERQKTLRDLFRFVLRMAPFVRDVYREQLATAAGLKLREFDRLLKSAENEGGAGGGENEDLISIPTIGGLIDNYLIETLYKPADGAAGATARNPGETWFGLRTPDGIIQTAKHVDIDGWRYVPPSPESAILIEGVVRFAPQVGELMSTRDIIRKIQSLIHKYVDIDVFYETLSAYYVLFSWLYDAFNTLPYLRVLGDAGTGKSRFLQVVGTLCYRPITVTGAATTSPIFRLLDRYRGTLVMDEGDFKSSDESADIVKILNTGYQRSQGIVLRAGAKENDFDPEVFICYGPKVIATRQKFADWALESRCLTKEMGGPTTRQDIPIELPRDFWTVEVPELQSCLLRYRLEHWRPGMELDYSQLDASIEPRLNQVMLSLVSIVDDTDLKDDLRSFMREYNAQLISERGLTLTAKVLEAVIAQWNLEEDKDEAHRDMSLKTIANRADQLMDFENLDEDEEYQGRKLTGKKVGEIARKQLQLQTSRSAAQNGRYCVVWNQARIDGLCARYGIDDSRLAEILAAIFDREAKEAEREAQKTSSAQQGFGGA